MPRVSKAAAAARASEAADADSTATVTINLESFRRTRDSLVTGLAILQDAIQTMSSDYIKHTNAVLGEHGGTLDVENPFARLTGGDNPLLSGALGGLRTASPAKVVATDGKKERKKRTHDPNAPKRPLTPFFLYMQTARSIIANDLGPEAAKGAVSAEGTRRWANMAAEDKQLWNNVYHENLRLYNARTHAYKNGNALARDMTDDEARVYAEEHNIEAGGADAQLKNDATAAQADSDEDAPVAKEPTPPPKNTPKNKSRAKKSKGAEATPTIVPAASIVPSGKAETPSTDKKRKRTTKKDEPASAGQEDKAKKSRAKKTKADA